MELLVIPFGGGNRHSYNYLKKFLREDIHMTTVALPGRGHRMNEELLTNAVDIVDDIYEQYLGQLHQPFAIYGHCVGGLLAYLVSRKLEEETGKIPHCLLVSGCPGPAFYDTAGETTVSTEDIRTMLLDFGTSEELLNNAEFFEMIEPMMRADFKVLNEYQHTPASALSSPITIIREPHSRFSNEELSLWKKETKGSCTIRNLSARISQSAQEFAKILNHTIDQEEIEKL